MDIIFKTISGILIALVLCHALNKQGKDISVLLAITVCCIVTTAAISYLSPVMDFFKGLQATGNLNTEMMQIMLKAVGIGLLTEITVQICADMGNASLGKSLQILSAAAMLWLSLPLFRQLLELLDTVLGGI